jgi:pimeloyl-ACP methyl ester carboxylesterase
MWWGFLAPLLSSDFDVVALDLTGHGDSGRRDAYPREVWARDVLAVLAHARLDRATLVGHSMGGFVSLVMAALHPERLAGAVLVDSPVRPAKPETASEKPRASGWTFDRMRPYPDFESAVERFRPLPDQPALHPALLEYVARRSIRQDADGFTWKFDPRVFERASTSHLRDYLAAARCPLALVRGAESSVLPRDVAEGMARMAPGPLPIIDIPDGHHHLMFDQPLCLLVALRAVLAGWQAAGEPATNR